ncbi:MAG: D-alanine--D-alanine ligase, partial [Proteobacteria bacterium]|nr:D-alanine--D-alanine ligase [Pseudomonadota bacterium]
MNIAVVFGGRSNEHEISVITALEVCKALDTNKHKLIPVYIDIKGRWFTGEELLKKDFYKNLPQSLEMVEEVALLPKPGTPGLKLVGEKGFSLFSSKKEFIEVDVFFPAFHGQFGEDGCIQGLFEMADVAYTGCNVLTSALAMDKFACKAMLQEQGIPVLPSTVVLKKDFQKNIQAVKANILKTKGLESFPLFVKPLSLGSSIGVSKAGDEAALDVALAKVFQYDTEAIVEPCVVNKLEIN